MGDDNMTFLLQTTDARVWAREFCRIAKGFGHDIDPEWMATWFANAMMAQHDAIAATLRRNAALFAKTTSVSLSKCRICNGTGVDATEPLNDCRCVSCGGTGTYAPSQYLNMAMAAAHPDTRSTRSYESLPDVELPDDVSKRIEEATHQADHDTGKTIVTMDHLITAILILASRKSTTLREMEAMYEVISHEEDHISHAATNRLLDRCTDVSINRFFRATLIKLAVRLTRSSWQANRLIRIALVETDPEVALTMADAVAVKPELENVLRALAHISDRTVQEVILENSKVANHVCAFCRGSGEDPTGPHDPYQCRCAVCGGTGTLLGGRPSGS